MFKTECRQMRVSWIGENCGIDKFCIGRSAKRHFAFLSPDEAKRVTSCPSCPHFYLLFQKTGPAWFACKPQFQKTEITNIYNPEDLKNFPFSWFCKLRLTWNPSLKSSFVHYCNFLQSTQMHFDRACRSWWNNATKTWNWLSWGGISSFNILSLSCKLKWSYISKIKPT